ncbi:MAG: hypothetical protein LQ350_006988 [Teloschistes chrysophthalmus]|nr:MAG: hypothetical protein LQ350_006988 [Niorma chrysophthalma]
MLRVHTALAGWWADRGHRSTPFFWGLMLAILSTLVFCLARAPGLLILGRALQGLAASVIYTAGLALVADAVGAEEIGAWMGFVFSGNTFGLLVSPFLAGVIYDHAGYYAVFGIIFGVFGLDLLLRAFMIEKRQAIKYLPAEQQNDTRTFDESQATEEGENNTTSESNDDAEETDHGKQHKRQNEDQHGEETEHTPLLRVLTNPMADESWLYNHFPKQTVLFRSPRLVAAIYGCLTHTMLLASIDSILPLFVKRTFEWTASGAGTIFLTITCPSLFGTVFGALADRYGSRLVSLVGLGLTTLNLGLMGLVKNNEILDKVLLCVFLVIAGVGLNLILAPLAADVFATVEALAISYPKTFGKTGAYAQAYALMTGALGLGTALGPILAGAMYENTNWPITVGFLAILCALPSVGVFFFTGGGYMGKRKE